MYHTIDLDRICRNLVSSIEEELLRVGVFYRIFYRVKTRESVENKKKYKGLNYYDGETKFLRDIIGIRVILYFSDDSTLIYNHLKTYFEFVEETIDQNEATRFAPTRANLIFKIPPSNIKEFMDVVQNKEIDSTFEVQLRTILSEGWHEVDHDLRYKCLNDWESSTDLSRSFNGVLATLETSEYSMLRLFEQLSYRHYKSKNVSALLKTKFRLRFKSDKLSEELLTILSEDLIKEIYKLDRLDVLAHLLRSNVLFPLTMANLIYALNYLFLKNDKILQNTPKEIINELKNLDN